MRTSLEAFSVFFQSLENGSESVNIQIFGTRKCNDTKKAQRFFKERGIKFQFVDMTDKGMTDCSART